MNTAVRSAQTLVSFGPEQTTSALERSTIVVGVAASPSGCG
jgi:hypothetical protein